ncbi:MAG: ATP-binding protein [Bacteroidetes bacterium]|nr:ATP-binding protein [Bacteroidota bacterium]MBU1719430.1 ATP-binding protein [Bacteroidota bacterium]
MLTKFSVSNFKGFNSDFIFDLQDSNGYAFNKECIKNGVVNNALVYGQNGVGKSNLGLAIFDIIGHLSDMEPNEPFYATYLNAYNSSKTANFLYEFIFDTCKVTYKYSKTDHQAIVYESFSINGNELAFIDRTISDEAKVYFKGTESLKTNLSNLNLSILKYVKNNSELARNEENECFMKFIDFVEGMLFFRSLQENTYIGLESGSRTIATDIIERGNVSDFEVFLNNAGVECKLTVVKESGKDVLAFDFNGRTIAFYQIASSGTRSLILFYYWLQRLREESRVSFLFIDEFDAFYHYELAVLIVKQLKKNEIQFILTTHNTSLMTNDLLRPDCYFIMKKESIKSLSRCSPKELREAHNLEKMYKADSFNA